MATYEYNYAQGSAANLRVGVKAGGVELALTSEATMELSVVLKFRLRSGIDYHSHRAAEGEGLLWE